MNAHFKNLLQAMNGGDTALLERFFRRPGGRNYLENITFILINTLPHSYSEKEALYLDFRAVLDDMEQHIRQKEGEEILDGIFKRT
jgi:hypothetical protein